MNFSSYPFDARMCYFQFRSISLMTDEIVYNGEWVYNPGMKVIKHFKLMLQSLLQKGNLWPLLYTFYGRNL